MFRSISAEKNKLVQREKNEMMPENSHRGPCSTHRTPRWIENRTMGDVENRSLWEMGCLLTLLTTFLGLVFVGGSSGYHEFGGKNVFSPTGLLVQADYVEGIVAQGPTCVGVVCRDGVVLVSARPISQVCGSRPCAHFCPKLWSHRSPLRR